MGPMQACYVYVKADIGMLPSQVSAGVEDKHRNSLLLFCAFLLPTTPPHPLFSTLPLSNFPVFQLPILVFRTQLCSVAFWKYCCQWEGRKSEKERSGVCYWFRVMPPVMPHTPGTGCLNVASALLSDGLLAQLLRRRLVEITW